MKQRCVISNYIPHRQPVVLNFQKWYNTYEKQLHDIYSIFREIVTERYDDLDIDWNSYFIFNQFINFIYDSSSKYIVKNDFFP